MLMFGMLGTFVGFASLINPLGIGAGVLMGGKTIGDERKKLITRRQNEAKTAMRRYVDDVTFQVGKDSRDRLRAVQRDLRDHFTEQAEQLKRSLQESLQAAERAVKASRGGAGGAAGRDRDGAGAAGAGPPAGAGAAAPASGDPAPAAGDRRRGTGGMSALRRRRAAGAPAGDRRPPRTTRTPPGWLHDQLCRLDEPLRVAIAGKVKAGKSTLLNALVGEQIAPTDAGECTRVVTWYRDGATPRIVLHPRDGRAAAAAGAPARRRAGDRPRRHARRASATGWSSTGPRRACGRHADRHAGDRVDVGGGLAAHRGLPRPRRRHAHRGRRRRLPDAAPARARRRVPRGVPRPRGGPGDRPVNAVAVLSRADEIGGGRVDAMFSARGDRRALPGRPDVRGLCQNVVAVAGLLAETGRTLRQAEFAALAALARAAARGAGGASCCRSTGSCGPDADARRDGRGAPAAAGPLRAVRHPALAPR